MSDYAATVERVYQCFATCPDPNARLGGEGWSVKEIVGHLVDSVCNNHQRLAHYRAGGRLDYPAYDQELCVERAHYADFDYQRLLALWYNHNLLLLHMIVRVPPDDLDAIVVVGEYPPVTLAEMFESYFAHVCLHEEQALAIIHAG